VQGRLSESRIVAERVRRLVELLLEEITDCLERGEAVKLSSFGSFVVRKKGQRIGPNPKTGTEVPISPRRILVFKPSAILKQRITRL
jgi:integration host factor subunit alpha